MATNNVINLKSSGIVSYDAAGTFTALANPLIVANGGTGVASNTAYAVLCGGTTSTNPIQSIAGVGSAGQALTSNGASNLPTFQAYTAPRNFMFRYYGTGILSPNDSTTYYIRDMAAISTTRGAFNTEFYVPNACTITKVYGVVNIAGTLGSAENVSIYVRVNNTTDTAITTTSQWTANPTLFSNAALSIAMSAGDFFEIKITTPVWATNPTNCSLSCVVYGV